MCKRKCDSVFPELVPCNEVAFIAAKQRANARVLAVPAGIGAAPFALLLGAGLLTGALALALAFLASNAG